MAGVLVKHLIEESECGMDRQIMSMQGTVACESTLVQNVGDDRYEDLDYTRLKWDFCWLRASGQKSISHGMLVSVHYGTQA